MMKNMHLWYSNCCNAHPTTEIESFEFPIAYCSECNKGAKFKDTEGKEAINMGLDAVDLLVKYQYAYDILIKYKDKLSDEDKKKLEEIKI